MDCEEVSLRIWDTSGQEKYKPIVSYHLRECQVIILMFDLTDFDSTSLLIQALPNWKTGWRCCGGKASTQPTANCW